MNGPRGRRRDYAPTRSVGFKNPVTLREGERVVAGTTSIADKNVVVILSADTTK